MDSFKHQYCTKIVSSFTDNIDIKGFDNVNSKTIYVVKIASNYPSGMILEPGQYSSVLHPYKVIPYTKITTRLGIAFINLQKECPGGIYEKVALLETYGNIYFDKGVAHGNPLKYHN